MHAATWRSGTACHISAPAPMHRGGQADYRRAARRGWHLASDSLYATLEVGAALDENSRIWVAGGLTGPDSATAKTEFYDPTVGMWSPGPDLPVPLHHAMMVSYRNTVWVIGGLEPQGSDVEGTASARVLRLDEAEGLLGRGPRRCIMRVPPARRRWWGTRSSWSAGGPAPPAALPRGMSTTTEVFDGTSWHDAAPFRFRAITWRPRRTASTCTSSAGASCRSPPIPRRCSASTRPPANGPSCRPCRAPSATAAWRSSAAS